jgi:hypothetical protein
LTDYRTGETNPTLFLKLGALVRFTNPFENCYKGDMGIVVDITSTTIGVVPVDVDCDSYDLVTATVASDPVYVFRTRNKIVAETHHKVFQEATRIQFPICLGYGSTADSCIGITRNEVLCECRRQFFSHGQLFMATTRGKICPEITWIVLPGQKNVHVIVSPYIRQAFGYTNDVADTEPLEGLDSIVEWIEDETPPDTRAPASAYESRINEDVFESLHLQTYGLGWDLEDIEDASDAEYTTDEDSESD